MNYLYFFIFVFSFNIFASELEKILTEIDISGTIVTESAITFDKMDSEKLEMILQPELNANLFDNISFTGIFRIRADMNDNLEPGKQAQSSISPLSRRILISENVDAELREFYFDSFLNDTAIRLGKQQVVWGQADGLKVLDVINPQSFREFILDEFVDCCVLLFPLLGRGRRFLGVLDVILTAVLQLLYAQDML